MKTMLKSTDDNPITNTRIDVNVPCMVLADKGEQKTKEMKKYKYAYATELGRGHSDFVKIGKFYEIDGWDEALGFTIKGNFCLAPSQDWLGCAHLGGKNWSFSDEKPEEN